jgi:hypothetical protein
MGVQQAAQSVKLRDAIWKEQVRIPAEQHYLLRSLQIGSGAHLASYPLGTNGCFRGGKVPGA